MSQMVRELTRRAAACDDYPDRFDPDDYVDTLVGNPATALEGQDSFWHVNLAPENAVHIIKSAPSVAAGVAEVAELTGEALEDYSGMTLDARGWFGLYEAVAGRFGKGAFGEVMYIDVLETCGETVQEPRVGDEEKGIDIRTDYATYQIKTTSRRPSPGAKKEADHLIWIKGNGEIVEV